MVETIQVGVLFFALAMLAYGLWLIAPAAMFCGIGGLLLTGIVLSRAIGKGKRKAS